MEIWTSLISITGLSTLALFLGRLIITKAFDAGVERYKSELSKDIEKYKADLSRISLEHQIRFSKLHEERAEKIKYLHSRVISLERALVFATTPAQGAEYAVDQKRDFDCINKTKELAEELDSNRIYFADSTIKKVENIVTESGKIIAKMRKVRLDGARAIKNIQNGVPVPDDCLQSTDLWDKAFNQTQNEFKILKEDLADEFRRLLGISTATPASSSTNIHPPK